MGEVPAGYAVRQGREEDLPRLARLAGPLALLDLCRAAGTLWIAADGDGAPVGVLAAGDLDGALHLHALAVEPAHRRRGLGSALAAVAIERARWALQPAATLVCDAREPAAAPFCARIGFVALKEEWLAPGLSALLAARGAGARAYGRRV